MGTVAAETAHFPMLFALEGSMQEYIYSLPVTLSVTLGISWILAMTFCTVLASSFIRAPKDPNKPTAPIPWLFAKLQQLMTKGGKQGANSTTESNDPVDRIFRKSVRAAIALRKTALQHAKP